MPREARIAIQNGTAPASTNVQWNSYNHQSGSDLVEVVANLLDTDNTATSWSLWRQGFGQGTSSNGPNAVGTGDASWVDEAVISQHATFVTSDAVFRHEFRGLDNNEQYTIEIVGMRDNSSGTWRVEASVDGFSTVTTHDVAGNTTQTSRIEDVSPSDGVIVLETRRVSGDGGQYVNALRIIEQASAEPDPDPEITSIEALRQTETANVVVENLPGAQGTVTLGGVSQTVNSWSTVDTTTTIGITVVRGTLDYDLHNLVVTDADANTANDSGELLPQTGWNHVDLVAPLADSGQRITAIPDLEGGDQLAWGNVQGGVIGDVTVNTDASFSTNRVDHALTSPSGTADGHNAADGSVSTDGAVGTLYWVCSTVEATPTVPEMLAGQSSGGAAAADSGNQSVSATGAQNFSASGLTAETTYAFHVYHRSGVTAFDVEAHDGTEWGTTETQTVLGDDEAVVSSASFTTDAPPPGVVSFDGPNISNITDAEVGAAITPVDVSGLFSDSENETLTFSAVGTWPAGVEVTSAGVIQGTPTQDGEYTGLAVRATNESEDTEDSNTFSITVAPEPTPVVANAGTNQTVLYGATVQLNGGLSTGDGLTYAWTQESGTAVTLSDATIVNPTFTAPGADATLVFQLEVTDEHEVSDTDTVMVFVVETIETVGRRGMVRTMTRNLSGGLSREVV